MGFLGSPRLPRPVAFCGLFLGVLASAASAQDQSDEIDSSGASDGQEIVVQGDRDQREVRKKARQFLDAVEIGRRDLQAARWEKRICPMVLGQDGEVAEAILSRIRAVAEQVGARVAPADCDPNLSVVFVFDGPDFVSEVHRKAHRRLKEVPRRKRDFVFESDAPVRWWYTTELKGSGGRPLLDAQPAFIQCDGDAGSCTGGDVLPSGPDTKIVGLYSSGRIVSQIERHIHTATVVVDLNKAAGTNVHSLADYIALVSLSEIWPEGGSSPVDTILTLFDEEEDVSSGFRALSRWDQKFLCALYKMPLSRRARVQKARFLDTLLDDNGSCAPLDETSIAVETDTK